MKRKELQKAYKEGLINDDAYKNELFKLETASKVKKKHRIYDSVREEEFMELIKHVKSKRILIAFYLAYGSGLRISEVLHLEPDEISNNTLMVRQGKGGKDRRVNVPKGFKKDWIKLLPLKITKMAIQKAFLKASFKANINKVLETYITKSGKTRKKYRLTFHCLRHSYGTRALEKGVPINQVQLLLGHANVSTTSRYIKANPVEAIQSIIDKGV